MLPYRPSGLLGSSPPGEGRGEGKDHDGQVFRAISATSVAGSTIPGRAIRMAA